MQDKSHIGKNIKSKNLIEVKLVRQGSSQCSLQTGLQLPLTRLRSCLRYFGGEFWCFGNLGGVYVVLYTVSILLAHSIIFKLSGLYV